VRCVLRLLSTAGDVNMLNCPLTLRALCRWCAPVVLCAGLAGAQPPEAQVPEQVPAGAGAGADAKVVAPIDAVPAQAPALEDSCDINLRLPGTMWDVLSNALQRTAGFSDDAVAAFWTKVEGKMPSGDALVQAAAKEFGLDEAKLFAEVKRLRHVNCTHGPVLGEDGVTIETVPDNGNADKPVELTQFARDVALHVVLHEIGHGLIREFGIPILANEETMADAFATHYLVTHMPDRAFDAIKARVTSLQIEAGEVARDQWPVRGEHDSDARRAYQIAALAVAADRAKYEDIARFVGMSAADIRSAVDYGAEIHRSWRRTLAPLTMPDGLLSKEANVGCDIADDAPELASHMPLMDELRAQIKRFDWHSFVKVEFVTGDGGANWNRNARRIKVYSNYLRRFVEQGRRWELLSGGQAEKQDEGR
jgi:hypothetical protein